MSIRIRPEEPADAPAIRRLLEAAFPTAADGRLVDLLRAGGHLTISLVAEKDDGKIVGHVAFSPVVVDGEAAGQAGLALAPLAVLPGHGRQGIGARLVREGLAACEAAGFGFVVVLGEPAYYRRLGFKRADRRGLGNEYDAEDVFLVLELRDGAIPARGGVVRYGAEFGEFTL